LIYNVKRGAILWGGRGKFKELGRYEISAERNAIYLSKRSRYATCEILLFISDIGGAVGETF
jgi:hypothetical protein